MSKTQERDVACLRLSNACGDVSIKSSFGCKEDCIQSYFQLSITKSTRPPSHGFVLLTLFGCCLNKKDRNHVLMTLSPKIIRINRMSPKAERGRSLTRDSVDKGSKDVTKRLCGPRLPLAQYYSNVRGQVSLVAAFFNYHTPSFKVAQQKPPWTMLCGLALLCNLEIPKTAAKERINSYP